ncbi:MAG: CtpF protein [Rhizobiales bacterium 62-17]|nr:CpaE family protein [Hyphomicrobiales bacterium]OJY00951.1 MAG: CtpF protein [Rhizobiales bacterium 62-17]
MEAEGTLDGDQIEATQGQIAPVPRVSIQAFCEMPDTADTITASMNDRRMLKAHVKIHMGGAAAAIEAYRSAPTPNVIVIECNQPRHVLLTHLDELADYCDAGTRVVVIGRSNDISLYRELMGRGVSEYIVSPFEVLSFVRIISDLYASVGATPVGRLLAVTGVKGGVGASSIAHNVAWAISREFDSSTVLVDMDLGFGTAGLDFNQDPPQGIAEIVFAPERLDANFVDRLLSKCTENLSLLAAPATLERNYDLQEHAFDGLIDILRSTIPNIVLDVPHIWTAWSRRILVSADEILVVASPDLASLRNTKSLLDTLRAARPNDTPPKLVMNFVGVPKRPEISVADFAKAIDLEPLSSIAFDPKLFGTAANNGQMIAEIDSSHNVTAAIEEIARILTGRAEMKLTKKRFSNPLSALLARKRS